MRCFSFEQLTNGETYYITYDYKMKISDDVVELAKENGVDFEMAIEKYRDVLTGRSDGSYFCEAFKAEMALLGNLSILSEAESAGYLAGVNLSEPEEIDIRLREYLLDYHKEEILKLAGRE